MKKKVKSLLSVLKKLPPIKRTTVNLLVALVVVGGIIGGIFIYKETFTEHAATNYACGSAFTRCPLPKTCPYGSISYLSGIRYCSNTCCFSPTISPTLTVTPTVTRIPTSTITPTTSCSIAPDLNFNSAVSSSVSVAQSKNPADINFSTAQNQSYFNVKQLQYFNITDPIIYNDVYAPYLPGLIMPSSSAQLIANASIRNMLKSSSDPSFNYSNKKMTAITNYLYNFAYNKLANLNPTTPKYGNSSQDVGSSSVTVSLPVKYAGRTVGGSLKATFQLKTSKYSQLNMFASYNTCRLASMFQGNLEGTIDWGVSYAFYRDNGTPMSNQQSMNISFTKSDDTRLMLNFSKSPW